MSIIQWLRHLILPRSRIQSSIPIFIVLKKVSLSKFQFIPCQIFRDEAYRKVARAVEKAKVKERSLCSLRGRRTKAICRSTEVFVVHHISVITEQIWRWNSFSKRGKDDIAMLHLCFWIYLRFGQSWIAVYLMYITVYFVNANKDKYL